MNAKIESLIQPILALNTWEERYLYFIDLGKTSPDFPSSLKTNENVIKGCQSEAWLYIESVNGTVYISGYSTSIFVNGFIRLLINIYSGENNIDIKNNSYPFLALIGMQEMVTPMRGNGLLAIHNKIKRFHE